MLNIGGKDIKLVFDLGAWEEIEEEYGSIEAMSDQLQSGQQTLQESKAQLDAASTSSKMC